MKLDVILSGTKIIVMTVNNVKFLNSLNFMNFSQPDIETE